MRFTLNLNNSLVFTPVVVPMPTHEEISRCLYENRKYITDYATQGQKKKFIAQWKLLINNFDAIIKKEIGHDLCQIRTEDSYENLLNRLKKGIIDSIFKNKDGLLPDQNNAAFYDLKSFLEALCFYGTNNSGEKRFQALLESVYQKLHLCGPGLFTHVQQAFHELYHPADNLFYWLADFRETILTTLVEHYRTANQVDDIYVAHIYTAFSARAKHNQWHLLQENKNLYDMLINVAIRGREDVAYAEFEKNFKEKYTAETIHYLSGRLTAFIVDKFNQYAVSDVLSHENSDCFDAFFAQITPVFDSFQLSLHSFLKETSEDDVIQYQLNQNAITKMEVYVAVSLYELGMLNAGPLYLLRVVSSECVAHNGVSKVGKKLIHDTQPEIWLHEFKLAFDANPPEAYQHELRRRISSLGLFRAISAFDNFLAALGLSNTPNIPPTDQLAVIVNSGNFEPFFTTQLDIKLLFLKYFQEKYPLQQEVVEEDVEPPRARARR